MTIATGNVLGNDGDVDTGDPIHVTGIAAGSVAATSSNVPASNVPANVPGTYGSVAIAADGQYTYTLNNPSIQSLAQGQTVTDTFTYTITDSQGASSATTLTVTVTGTNDAPNVYVGSGDSAAASLNEDDAGLVTGGTLSLYDVDTQDTVSVSRTAVSAGGTYSGLSSLSSKVTPAQLLAMMTVTGSESSTTSQSADHGVNWAFDSGTQAFNFIPAGETLVLTYTIRARDNSGVAASRDDFQTVTITITGTDDGIVLANDVKTMAENASGTACTGNVLTNDSVDPDFNELTQVTGFSVDADGNGEPEDYLPGDSVTIKAASGGTLGVFTLATDGAYSFTPYAENFSGTLPTITYTAVSPTAHTGKATLNITVTPVSDAPRVTPDAVAINTAEDTSVALGFNRPTLSSDTVDQNGPAAGDNPERLGLITLSGIPSGAQLLDGTNGNAALFTSNGGAITVLLSDVPAAQMIANPGAATLTMTRTQFEAMRVLPAADNATNFTATMSVTEYEVDAAGNPLSGIAGATTSTTVAVDVRAVTDLVDLKIGGSDTTYSATISEDTPLNLTALLSASFADLDGSEQRSITFSNPSGNGTIYVNGHAVAGGASYTIAATDAGNDLETSPTGFPTIVITTDNHFSGDLKGVEVTLSAKDTDADSTVNTLLQSNSVMLDLYVKPVADPVTVTNVVTREDTAVRFLQGIALTDTDGSETLTGITINALPDDWVLRDNTGNVVHVGDGATPYTVPASALVSGVFRDYTITPPAHSSDDISVSLSLTSTDTRTVNGTTEVVTQTNLVSQSVTVTPVAERVGTDTDVDSTRDLTINPDHLYTTQGAEDDWYALKQDGEGFNPQTGWSNQDTDERTYALLTPTLGGNAAIGSQFSYTAAGVTHVLTYTGTAVRIPLSALDTVQFKAASDVAGTFEIRVQALTVDTDPNTGATVEATSGLATLTGVVIAPVADPVTLAVNAPAVGNEDSAIPLIIRPTSADPSETFTVTISGIPAGTTITYGGVDQTVVGGSVSIANFNPATKLTMTPPLNSNADIPLTVSAVSVDVSDGITSTSTTASLPLLVDVRGVADPVSFAINSPWTTTEATVDATAGRRIALSGALTAVTPIDSDGSESVTVVVSGVPTGVSLQGLTFMGGVGASRVWSGTPAEIAAAGLVVRDANFSGTISFSVRAVSTENDGNSLSGPASTVTIAVTPSPEAVLVAQTTAAEDTRTQVDFSIVAQNGDTDETLLSVWIDAADLASKPFTLYLGNVPLTTALTADGGWYKLSATDAANVYVQGAANGDTDAGFAVRYAISDPGRNGLPDTVTQFDGTYSINVAAVTDATVSSNSYAGGEIASTTTIAVDVTVTQQGDAGAGNLPDTDGSEQLRYFIIDNVPLGVSVEGGRYIGNTPGNANTGRWILDVVPDVAFNTASLSQTINFALNGTSEQLNDLNQPINVTAYTQDGSGALRTSTTTWTLDTADGFVASGSGSGAPAATIVDWHPATSTGMSEDTPKSLAGLVSAEITGTSPYAVTITGLPAGSAISGMMLTSIGGQDVWTAQGEGDNASLQSLLASITITPPANLNSNTPGGFSFATTLTTYDNSGTRHDASAAVMPPVAPVSDASVIATTNTDVAEDQTVPITLSLSNAADGAKAQVVDGHVYIRLDESGMDAAGKLSVGGTELLATSVSGVAGIPDGMYFVLSGVSSTDTLSLSYQPAVNASGSVSYTAYVQNQEIGAANVVTSSQTGAFTISPENDGATVSVSPANGLEDTLIPLSIGVSQTDASETIASVTLDNVPDGFLVYAGGQLAINLGGGVWGIPLSGGHLPANVALMPPINWSGTLTPLHLSVWSGEPDLDPTLTTSSIAVSVNGVADGISLTPTLSFGDERAIVPLNLNSTMTDHDGSETATLTISKLGAYAAFYTGTTLLATSYDALSDTYTLSGLTPDQVTGLGVIQKNGSYDLQITAHTVESVGGDASASLPTTLHLDINPIAATSGNDTLLYGGSALNGLAGVDTIELRLGEDIDFATAVKPTNIERIDLMPGGQDHSLNHLTLQDVLDMTGSSKTLTILGDNGDAVGLKNGVASDDQWVKDLATVTDGTHVFDVYTNAHDTAVKILIDQQITQRHIDS